MKRDIEVTDNCIIQIGASIYGLVNIIPREKYDKFAGEFSDDQ